MQALDFIRLKLIFQGLRLRICDNQNENWQVSDEIMVTKATWKVTQTGSRQTWVEGQET
jgi:hypothetical protein